MTAYEIPLSPTPQQFRIALGPNEYELRFTYQNVPEGGWVMDITDSVTSEPLVCGVPLVTGADLLAQYAYLGIPGALYATTDGNPDAKPVFANLGTTAHLLYVTA